MSSSPQLLTAYPELIAAVLLALALVWQRLRPQAERSNYAVSSFSFPAIIVEPATTVSKIFPKTYVLWLQEKINYAGLRSNTFYGSVSVFKFYPLLIGSLLFLFIHPGFAALSCLLLFFAADFVLATLARRRQKALSQSLPQIIDLMVLCVDAGLGLDATIHKVASERTGLSSAINDELLTLSRDVLLGMNREKAYQELYKRTGVDELRSLSAALNQSAQLGISVSKVLRTQADFLRNRLSQKAEEKAARLPVLMSFPLWFCIMPTLMVLVLAPSLIIFFEQVRPLTGFGLGP